MQQHGEKTYEQTMAWGADQYRDVINALAEAGLDAEFTQTGGMCAALEVVLDNGMHLLFTDREDTLSWDRQKHEGWLVALYPPHDRGDEDGPIRFASDPDGSASGAISVATRLLDEFVQAQRRP